MEKKMTIRDFYTAVISANINDELTTYATDAIAKLDLANEKRKNKPKKANPENLEYIEQLKGALTSVGQTAADLCATVGISVQKASALMRQIVESGFATKEDVKVPGKGSVKAYRLAE